MEIISARRDEREIRLLLFENSPPITVGLHGVTQIVAYEENGEMAAYEVSCQQLGIDSDDGWNLLADLALENKRKEGERGE